MGPDKEHLLRRAPQKPLRGRWGSATSSETDLIVIGEHLLGELFLALLDILEGKKQHKRRHEPEIDEEEGFVEKDFVADN